MAGADAALRNLEIAGEATKRVPLDFRVSNPGIEWRKVAGLRDIHVHECASIMLGIIWDVIQNKLPDLCERLTKISGTPSESQFED